MEKIRLKESQIKIVESFEKNDLTVEQMANELEVLHQRDRMGVYLKFSLLGPENLSSKVLDAIYLIDQRLINNFKKSVENNTYNEFLSNISEYERKHLLLSMNISDLEDNPLLNLTQEELNYYNILITAIRQDKRRRLLESMILNCEQNNSENSSNELREENKIIDFSKYQKRKK